MKKPFTIREIPYLFYVLFDICKSAVQTFAVVLCVCCFLMLGFYAYLVQVAQDFEDIPEDKRNACGIATLLSEDERINLDPFKMFFAYEAGIALDRILRDARVMET